MNEGPTTTVSRSCFDCKYCESKRYICQKDSGSDVRCLHPNARGNNGYIGDTHWNTPNWCPYLGIKPQLDKAYEIYFAIFGQPTDHQQWAEAFNIRERIRILLIK